MELRNASSGVTRATRILLALGEANASGLSLSALAELIGDAKPTLHRTLVSMAETGFVVQRSRRGRYFLGPAIYALAQRTTSVADLVEFARPKLLAVTAKTGFSSFLMVRAGLDSICIDMQPGRILAPAMVEGVGGRVPLGVGMAGVVLLGQLDRFSCDTILAANRPMLDRYGLRRQQILDEIAAYHLKGFAYGHRAGQNFINRSIAFPLIDIALPERNAAISVLAPEGAEEAEALEKYAAEILKLLYAH